MSAPPELPDAEVVRRILDGDRETGSLLVLRHEPMLRTLIRRRLSSRDGFGIQDVENALQQVWLKVFGKDAQCLRIYEVSRPLQPYLATVALNACRDYLKMEGRKRRTPPPELASGLQPPPDKRLEEEETRQEVRQALDRMDPDERMILDLVDLQELTQVQAASLMALPFRRAGTLLEKARRNFRKQIERRRNT